MFYDFVIFVWIQFWMAPVESRVHVRAMNDPCIQSLCAMMALWYNTKSNEKSITASNKFKNTTVQGNR